ncbi:MAG: GGDEF domain-containing protein [Minisyncoccota bacterium]
MASFENPKQDPTNSKTSGSAQEVSEAMREQDLKEGLLQWHVEYLEEQRGIDHLTGLKLRKPFEEELERLLKIIRGGESEGRRESDESIEKEEIGVIFIDIDDFSSINDTYGHAAGDEVLQGIANLLKVSVRELDMVARYGGEEIVVLLRGTSTTAAVEVAEKLRVGIEQLTFNAYPKRVTASLGVATSASSLDGRALCRFADGAMYEAKQSGKNKVVVYKGK